MRRASPSYQSLERHGVRRAGERELSCPQQRRVCVSLVLLSYTSAPPLSTGVHLGRDRADPARPRLLSLGQHSNAVADAAGASGGHVARHGWQWRPPGPIA